MNEMTYLESPITIFELDTTLMIRIHLTATCMHITMQKGNIIWTLEKY